MARSHAGARHRNARGTQPATLTTAALAPASVGDAACTAVLARVGLVAGALESARDRSDIEHVHKLRTSLRRLRAAMTVYAPLFRTNDWRVLRDEVAALFRASSPLRDLDVQRARLSTVLDEAPPEARAAVAALAAPGVERMTTLATAGEERFVGDLLRALDTFERAATLRRIAQLAVAARDAPSTVCDPDVARRSAAAHGVRAVRKRVKAARSLLESDLFAGTADVPLSAAAPEALHDLRIAVKKLRYAGEVCRDVVPVPLGPPLATLSGLQEILGDLHDVDVRVADCVRAADTVPASAAAGLGFLLGESSARRAVLCAALDRDWTTASLHDWLRRLARDLRRSVATDDEAGAHVTGGTAT